MSTEIIKNVQPEGIDKGDDKIPFLRQKIRGLINEVRDLFDVLINLRSFCLDSNKSDPTDSEDSIGNTFTNCNSLTGQISPF